MDSILTSIKKLLGISEEYTQFDQDIIVNVNSTLSILSQLGVGTGFFIVDDTTLWSDLIGEEKRLELIKTYVFLKVKLLFDPPISSAAIESTNKLIDEFQWRIQVEMEEIQNGS